MFIYTYTYIVIHIMFRWKPAMMPTLHCRISVTFAVRSCIEYASALASSWDYYGLFSKLHVCFCGLDSGNLNLRQYGQISNVFAFRI